VDMTCGVHQAFLHHRIYDCGIMMLDTRACKTFLRPVEPMERGYLGEAQWRAMEQALAEGGLFDGCKSLVVCSPVPVAFLSPVMTETIAKGSLGAADDLEGLWTGNGAAELEPFLEMLYRWKKGADRLRTDREVTIVAGDIHIGLTTDILCQNEFAFCQLTTSAMHNSSVGDAALEFIKYAGGAMSMSLHNKNAHLTEHWQFKHWDYTDKNNYGLVAIQFSDECGQPLSKPHVKCSLRIDQDGAKSDHDEAEATFGVLSSDDEGKDGSRGHSKIAPGLCCTVM